jgi:hypothetical protein
MLRRAGITQETGRRSALLIAGTGDEIRAADHKVSDAQLALERIEARAADLRPQLSRALGREHIAEVETLLIDAETAAEKFRRWLQDGRYAELAREIAEGLEWEREARIAIAKFDRAATEADGDEHVQAAGGVRDREVPPVPWTFIRSTAKSMALLTCLPAVEPGQPPFCWPDGYSLSRAQVGVGSAYG